MACNNQTSCTGRSSSDDDADKLVGDKDVSEADGQNIEAYVEHANSSVVKSSPLVHVRRGSLNKTSWSQLLGELRQRRRTSSPKDCAMCNDYENRLQVTQMLHQENKKQLLKTVTELEEKSKRLEEITTRHAELEGMLEARVTSQQELLVQLEDKMKHMTARFEKLLSNYRQHRKATEYEIRQLQKACEAEQADFQLLQSHYDSLVGRRTRATAELSEQPINIPSDKTELELMTLKLYEENLALRAAREHLDDRLLGESDVSGLQDSGDQQQSIGITGPGTSSGLGSRTEGSRQLRRQLDEARAQLVQLSEVVVQRDAEAALRARCDEQIKELRTSLAESQAKMAAKEAELATTRTENDRLQTRVLYLQNDLENIESVQADFVRLSQNLQMQLERLRQEETVLRWVDPDHATECYACQSVLPNSSTKKVNCRHCGKVHCSKCLRHFTSPTSPGRRPQPVCGLCHTLLNKHAAPYFSTAGIKEDRESSPRR